MVDLTHLRRFALMAVGSLALVTVASPAAARSPRLERLALDRSDMHRAASALLRRSDLAGIPPGWRPLSTTPDDSAPICPWQDYSRYTLTGRGEADFQPTKVGSAGFVGSSVEVLATSDEASGRFGADTHAGTVSCEAEALRKAFGSQLETASARQLASPKLGDHAFAYEFVYEQPKGTPKRIYVNIIEFVRGREVAVLDTTNFDAPGSQATRVALARAIDQRLR